MKMTNKKFVAMATSLGVSVSLLSGCGVPTTPNPQVSSIDDDDDDDKRRGGTGVFAGTTATGGSKAVSGGKSGIGSAKGGGAGS